MTPGAEAQDRLLLARAVAVAGRPAPTTSPNPRVGCVVAVDGAVVGEGATAPAGGPHAEVAALAAAGEAADGATAYVTLEPCAHQGRTPPCTGALVAAGIRRVVFVHPEPNGAAAGGGAQLRSAGVEASGPLPADDLLRRTVALQLEGFLSRVRTGRPHLTLKLAQTVDGALAAPAPHRWITGPQARRAVHRLRAASDGVLVGSGTVLADDPRLDARDVDAPGQPRPVVFDARLRTPPSAAVVARGALVVTRCDPPGGARRSLEDAGAQVFEVPGSSDGGGGVDLDAALRAVADAGLATLLAEPGATLARALLDAGVVDRLVLHVALGTGAGPPRRVAPRPQDGPWRVERSGGAGADLILHSVPDRIRRRAPLDRTGGT